MRAHTLTLTPTNIHIRNRTRTHMHTKYTRICRYMYTIYHISADSIHDSTLRAWLQPNL